MELRKHCAYNRTRECFLGLDVAAADLSDTNLEGLMATLALKSGEGLWMVPFRGIPATGPRSPMDLIFLDEGHCVMDIVESYPTFQAGASSPQPASVLALPAHSIYSSQTQPGDQMVLCVAEEMEHQLGQLSSLDSDAGAAQEEVLSPEQPLWSFDPGVAELEEQPEEPRNSEPPVQEVSPAEPQAEGPKSPRKWQGRWWSSDPRKAPRLAAPDLVAYYWDGAKPEAHDIRDISSTGLYVVTEERWYPGTLVLMTLFRKDASETAAERWIAVQSQAIRWGQDGVGLRFVAPSAQEARKRRDPDTHGADKNRLEKFLRRWLKFGKRK